jgi:hypothetical protein
VHSKSVIVASLRNERAPDTCSRAGEHTSKRHSHTDSMTIVEKD